MTNMKQQVLFFGCQCFHAISRLFYVCLIRCKWLILFIYRILYIVGLFEI